MTWLTFVSAMTAVLIDIGIIPRVGRPLQRYGMQLYRFWILFDFVVHLWKPHAILHEQLIIDIVIALLLGLLIRALDNDAPQPQAKQEE